MLIKILPGSLPNGAYGKLADVELHFPDGDLAGLKLIGFSIWETTVRRFVAFPSRTYSVGGERRSFALLRPFENEDAKRTLETRILAAYDMFTTNLEFEQATRRAFDEDQEASDVTSSPFALPRP